VFLTVRSERAEQRAGMTLGADDYISKPFSERDILAAIAARTGRLRGIHERIAALTEQHRREIHAHWSHELLTPLNAVMGSLQLLDAEADTISRNDLKEILALVREAAERQERLAQKLIAYFRLEQRLHAPLTGTVLGCQAENAIIAGAARAAGAKSSPARLACSGEPGEVAVDEDTLACAIGEVVSNALNFSAPHGFVNVLGTNRGNRYRIEIIDNGPGLTTEQRASIGAFTQFERHVHEQQGLGLGLAIARATATLAGGHLTFGSPPGARGLTVVFDLPVKLPAGAKH
jgi:two-component system, sensor histidine kinase and response regulator